MSRATPVVIAAPERRARGARYVRCVVVAMLAAIATALVCQPARACRDGNLLADRAPRSARGVGNPSRLNDGVLSIEGGDVTSVDATPMTGMRPYVEWDLGEPTRIDRAAVQADNNDVYRITGSLDGKVFTPIWTIEPVKDAGLRERLGDGLGATARFVRFEALSGDRSFAASEVRLYCGTAMPWPPYRVVRDREPVDPDNTHGWQGQSVKLVVGLLCLPLLFVLLPRFAVRRQKKILAALAVYSALAWTQFGHFNGGNPLHAWDSFHYFMGTKYFPETGYFDLYRCGAREERESGRDAEMDRSAFRDVETNRVYPGDYTRTEAGRCRASFTQERWRAFKADIETYRALFDNHTIAQSFSDHGFNATPVNVAWLRLWTHDTTATPAKLVWLAQLDSVALVGTIAALWWGFGALPAVVAALVLATGGLWNYHWVGGSLGRHTWLFCCALGFALLAKNRPFAGGVALTLAGLLRLFPFVFVGGVGVWVVVNAVKGRHLDAAARRFLAGTAATFVLGVTVGGTTLGWDSYRDFRRVFDRHSHSPLSNQLGLSTIVSWTAGENTESLFDPQLTNAFERWENHQLRRREERRPLWAFAVAISLGVIALSAARGAGPAECGALSALLLFCALPMTSYDYTWLVVLVALWKESRVVLPALLGFALFTHVLFVFGGEATEAQHLIASIACLALIAATIPWRALWNDVLARIAPTDPAPM